MIKLATNIAYINFDSNVAHVLTDVEVLGCIALGTQHKTAKETAWQTSDLDD